MSTAPPLNGSVPHVGQRPLTMRHLQQRHVQSEEEVVNVATSAVAPAASTAASGQDQSPTSSLLLSTAPAPAPCTPARNGRASRLTTTTTTTNSSTTSDHQHHPCGNGSSRAAGSDGRAQLSSYVLALRPWSFSASFIPVALGCALAHKSTGEFNPLIWLVTCITALSVHAAGNVVNTYYDYQKGIDSRKCSDDRTLVDELLTPDQLVHLGALLYCLGCAGFLLLVALSPARMEHLALVYFGGLSSSFVYTGGIGLKYIGLGEVLVLVIFGPITVLFAYTAQTGSLHPVTLLYAMPLALNTEAILHSNNSRDLEADRRVGIVTLAILLGHTGSHVLFALLLFVPYMVLALMGLHLTPWLLLPLITVPNAFRLERHFRQGELQALPRLTAKLNVYFGLFYVIGCVVAGRGQLPGLA